MADQLNPIPLVAPGSWGLNKAQSSVPDIDTRWAVDCQNMVLDQTGRLAARQGTAQIVAGLSQTQRSMGELITPAGVAYIIFGTEGVSDFPIFSIPEAGLPGGTYTAITGALTPTGANWQWMPFNGSIYGVQANNPLIVWTGTGNATTAPLAAPKSFTGSIATGSPYGTLTVTAISSGVLGSGDLLAGAGITAGTTIVAQLSGTTGGTGTYSVNFSQTVGSETMTVAAGVVPSGGIAGCSAFGRLWIVNSDLQTISYCALLDATTWNGTGAGSLNMATVWTRGLDQIVGIAAAGNKLVVFGTRQIVIFYDNTNPPIGLNPTNISVFDTVEGTGLAARDTVQSTSEGDLTFLSPTGVQSLARLITSGKNNPVKSLDPQIHDYFNTFFQAETASLVKSVYSPTNRFYLIFLPAARRTFCYDTRQPLPDGSLRVTEWTTDSFALYGRTCGLSIKSGALILGSFGGSTAVSNPGIYGGYVDGSSTSYSIVYTSPYLALSSSDPKSNFENRLKILKRLKAIVYYTGTVVINFLWGFDFGGLSRSQQVTLTGVLSEYGISQFNVNEFGGSAGTGVQGVVLGGSGRWLQFGITAIINNAQLALQELDAFAKIGNLV